MLVPDLEEAVPGPCGHSHPVVSHPQAADAVVMPGQDTWKQARAVTRGRCPSSSHCAGSLRVRLGQEGGRPAAEAKVRPHRARAPVPSPARDQQPATLNAIRCPRPCAVRELPSSAHLCVWIHLATTHQPLTCELQTLHGHPLSCPLGIPGHHTRGWEKRLVCAGVPGLYGQLLAAGGLAGVFRQAQHRQPA